ncbi:MAG: hypothetical protein AAGA65_19795 [Actinomycetota bacterium]
MSAIVLLATITAVLRLYAGHPYRFHILALLLGAIGIECLLLAAIAAVRARRLGPVPRDLDQAAEDARRTVGCVDRSGRNVVHRPNPTKASAGPRRTVMSTTGPQPVAGARDQAVRRDQGQQR